MLNNPGIIIFSEPNFLGASFFYNGPPIVGTPMVIGGESGSGPNAIRLGSFAITGIAGINQGNYWRLCADVMCITAVCIDLSRQRGNLYLNKNSCQYSTGSFVSHWLFLRNISEVFFKLPSQLLEQLLEFWAPCS
jgi:hypothetical protein